MKKSICLGFVAAALMAGSAFAAQPLTDVQMNAVNAGGKKVRSVGGYVGGGVSGSLAGAIGKNTRANTKAGAFSGQGRGAGFSKQRASGKYRFSGGASSGAGAKVNIKSRW